MRASRPLSARLATLGTAVAIATLGLVGTAGLVATAGPAGATAGTPVGNSVCNLAQPAGTVTIPASVTAHVSPSPVNAGNVFSIAGLSLNTALTSTSLTSQAAGETLTVTFTTSITATNASPASQTATFSGSVTLPKPFPIGSSANVSLPGTVGTFTAASAGALSTDVFFNPSGNLSVALGTLAFAGPCTGSGPVQIASAPIKPAAGFITNVIPNAGVGAGGTTVKLVGTNFTGVSKVQFGDADATHVRLISPTVITCVTPPGSNADYGDGATQDRVDVVITTPAGPSKKQGLDAFTYVDPTLGAIVSSVTPNVGTSAGGNAVTISGIGFNGYNNENSGPAFAVFFGKVNQPNFTVVNDHTITTTAPPGTGLVDVTVVGYDESTPSPLSPFDRYNYNPGYILGGSDGGIYSFGQVPGHAGFFGSAGSLHLNKPIVGMSATPDGGGYWLVASDGGVFSYGDAQFYGSTGNITLNKPIVGIVPTLDGAGYWLVAADGGVFSYGDAPFFGSAGNLALNKPIVGMARTANGNGYWMVAADGGIFAYGDAYFAGSAGNLSLIAPIVGMTPNPAGTGYWMVAADGGIFNYGAAQFHGSLGGTPLATPISAIAATPNGGGYWLVAQGGAVFNEGNAGFYGDMAGLKLGGPIVGVAAIQGAQLPV